MQGLHLTGDLFECGCNTTVLTDLDTLSTLCRDATLRAGLTIVDEKYHAFPDWQDHPGGITGTVLLAESHLAIHTWPERRGVTLDVYVCNFTEDNSGRAQQLFDELVVAFRPRNQFVNRITRGDLAAGTEGTVTPSAAPAMQRDELIFDWLNAHSGYGFTAKQRLETKQSPHQRVEVYDTYQFGRLFRLDGRLMTSEGDEFFYHECMTHPALLTHRSPQSALVIGGGDGGSSKEIFKHPSVKRIVMAELDPVVIDISKRYLRGVHHGAFDDPRLEVRIGDGFEYVKNTHERFDLIVLDLTDPDTPAFRLYSEEFFRMCQRILNPGGLLTLHLGTPVFEPATVKKNTAKLRRVFRHVHPLALYIPLYGSLWCLGVASDSANPRAMSTETIAARLAQRRIGALKYYNAPLHAALFTLPNFVLELTDGEQPAAPAQIKAIA